MLAEILERNKALLKCTGSYLLPQLEKMIEMISDLEVQAGTELLDYLRHHEFAKGEYLIKEGSPCQHLWLLETGIARQFRNKKGAEPTACFYFPGEFIVSFKSFAMYNTSNANVQFLTASSVFSLSLNHLEKLKQTYPLLDKIVNLGIECQKHWFEDRMYQMLFTTAQERYHYVECCLPMLIQHLSVSHVAAFLGISLETLSRIRAKV